MKAKDYLVKYGESVYREALDGKFEAGRELFLDFAREFREIAEQRGIKSDRAAVSLIKELNQKWNALAALFEAKYGEPVLKRNAVIDYYVDQIPTIALYLRKG